LLCIHELASERKLYTPKLEKEMKFVAHDATIDHDIIYNKIFNF
jgi:hypothetical protein